MRAGVNEEGRGMSWLKEVEELRRRGAPVHEADAEPWATPMAWARKMGHEEVMALLEGS